MKKRVLFVISQLHKGGAEMSTVNLLKKLDHSKHDVDFLVLNQVPVKNAISLIDQIPSWVRVCDAFDTLQKKPRIVRGIIRRTMNKDAFSQAAIRFVEGINYDLAVHIGEWFIPEFVALVVTAKKKAVWFHTDINRDKNFNANGFFAFDELIDEYLFVSELSRQNSCRKYSFIKNKSFLLHNAINEEEIRELSGEKAEFDHDGSMPVVLTVANLRPEKNHMRQLEVMHILKEKGYDFIWWNIGFKNDLAILDRLEKKRKEYGLDEQFLLLGPKPNPFPEMKRASVVACLSDYESWSMVITEALALNKPVIATKTSGALEQIIHGENGLLTDFTTADIAEHLEQILFGSELLQKKVAAKRFDPVEELCDILQRPVSEKEQAKVLFVIDDVNYPGGAHFATFAHINELIKQGITVDVFSNTAPSYNVRVKLPHVCFYMYENTPEYALYTRKILECLLSPKLNHGQKMKRLKKLFGLVKNPRFVIDRKKQYAKELFDSYDTVCVISEGSEYKKTLAECHARKKIQWIHTDYCSWAEMSSRTREVSKYDGDIWKNIDSIIVLSEKFKDTLSKRYPHLASKISVIANQIDEETIHIKADYVMPKDCLKIVSCSRVSEEKNIDGIIRVLHGLKQKGYQFHWNLLGDGEGMQYMRDLIEELGMQTYISLLGYHANPYPFIKDADMMMQFSYYEGLPLTVYESMVLGKPVLATDVGAISEQIAEGENGWLIPVSESALAEKLEEILRNPDQVKEYQRNLQEYHFDNLKIHQALGKAFG